MSKRPPTGSDRIRKESEQKYLILILFTLVIVGGGLIALIYGLEAVLAALPCLLGGAGLILVPWLLLTALERWRNRSEAADMEMLYSEQTGEKDEGAEGG
jgi:membrane protein implicated in regulation of membrane protease activity